MRRDGPPRVVALLVPDLPLQRVVRGREPAASTLEPRPLAVIADGRILCMDVAASAAGVRRGSTLAEALAASGRLVHVAADPVADRAALRGLAEAMLGLVPAVELAPPDGLVLDAGAAHLLARPPGPGRAGAPGGPDAAREAEELLARRALAVAAEMGYAARAAIATGRGPARALARHGEDPVSWVAPGCAAGALARLPVDALGLAPDVAARLRALGVESAGALARLPEGTLAHRFGPDGVLAARLARGEDPSPLAPYVPELLPEEALDLEAPAASAEPLLFALKRLADRVAARLSGRGLGASRLEIVLRLDPRGEERLPVPLAAATATAARWLLPVKEHLFSLRLPAPVVAVRLAAVEVAAVAPEQLAIGDRPEALAALAGVLDRLAVRLGDGAIFAAEPVDRHRPEAAYRAVPFRPHAAGAPSTAARPRRATTAREPPHPDPLPRRGRGDDVEPSAREGDYEHPPSPPAERGERAGVRGAGVRGSADGARPTRLLAAPARVVAEGEGGRVTALRIDGRARAVLSLDGPERLRGEWWAGPYDRDYYRVRLEGLGDCWVYRDGGDGRLYLHGFFD